MRTKIPPPPDFVAAESVDATARKYNVGVRVVMNWRDHFKCHVPTAKTATFEARQKAKRKRLLTFIGPSAIDSLKKIARMNASEGNEMRRIAAKAMQAIQLASGEE